MSVRSEMVVQGSWGIEHEPSIHYAQTRPIPLTTFKAHKLPLTTDCSGFVTCCAFAAGAPDPNGLNYNGQGYTGTLMQHCEHITKAKAIAGDFVTFGAYPGEHVVMLLQDGSNADPWVVSHGTEGGPDRTRLSAEISYFHGKPVTYLRSVPIVVSKKFVWDIRNGRNQRIAKGVKNPATYAKNHPKMFRKFDIVSYHKREV